MALAFTRKTRDRLAALENTLDSFIGLDAQFTGRQFPYVRNAELRKAIERDYRELTVKLVPTECWKSVVVLAGSVLEGLLHDLLTRDDARIADAMNVKGAPPRPTKKNKPRPPRPQPRDLKSNASDDEWLLNDYIEVADKLKLLPDGWKNRVLASLRDFRNFIHPRRELKEGFSMTKGEALVSVGMLICVCDHIEKYHP